MQVPRKIIVLSTFLMVSAGFAMPYGIGCATDLDNDGAIGVSDILIVIDRWGDRRSDCKLQWRWHSFGW